MLVKTGDIYQENLSLQDTPDCPVKTMTGHTLARNGYSKSQRAAFAASVKCGEIDYIKPTLKDLAKVFGVSVPYIEKALALSPLQRAGMRYGLTKIADIPPSTAELRRTVARAGTESAWKAICNQL